MSPLAYHCTVNTIATHDPSTIRPCNRTLSVTNRQSTPLREEPIIATKSSPSFTFYYQNVRGLRTKTNDLLLALSRCEYDVIALTETWLNSDIKNSELSNNYSLYRCDRNPQTSQCRRGGGTMIAVRNDIQSTAVCIAGCDQLEQIIVRISMPNFRLLLCSIYLPPNSDLPLYERHVACVQNLVDLAGERDAVLVVGDYNLPQLCWTHDEILNCMVPTNASSEQEIVLVESVIGNGLFQVNDIRNINGRLLDLAFTSDTSCIEVLEPPLSLLGIDQHHRPFMLLFEFADENRNASRAADTLCFDFARCDFTALNRLLAEVHWEDYLIGCSVDESVSNFYTQLFAILRDVVPLKQQRPSRSK